MKKLIAFLAVVTVFSVGSLAAQELSVSTTYGWESEYVFRGIKLAQNSFQPTIDVSYGNLYTGIWSNLPSDGRYKMAREIDFYAGYGFSIGESVSMDLGATHYYYPDFSASAATTEMYLGASFDVALSPAIYLYYDFDLDAVTFEGSIGHSWDVAEDTSFDLSAYAGYLDQDSGIEYSYLGVSADVKYVFTDYASASIGVRGTVVDDDTVNNNHNGSFWWGVSFSAGF